MDLEDVILFLNFFIKHCSSKSAKDWWAGCLKKRKQIAKRLNGWTSDNENWNWTLEGAKKSMISYKNSLVIANHFKTNLQ